MPGPILTTILSGPVIKAVETIIDRVIVDKNIAEKTKAEVAKEWASADIQSMLAQLEINKIEAQSEKWWKAGARPFIMWVGGVGFAVQFVFIPFVSYGMAAFGFMPPAPLVLDPVLYSVIFGLLGIGYGSRTYEKTKGVV